MTEALAVLGPLSLLALGLWLSFARRPKPRTSRDLERRFHEIARAEKSTRDASTF